MIRGIGVDLVDVARVEELHRTYGARFSRRILAESEWADFETSSRPIQVLANRFAAKEAFSKAMGTGIRHPVTFHSVSVVYDDAGRPGFRFFKQLPGLLAARGISAHHLTLTHEKGLVCAMVVIEG